MAAINFLSAEIQTGKIRSENLQAAFAALNEDGYVILNELVSREHAAVLRDRMLEDTERILERKDVPFNFNVGNIQQDPPPFPPYLFLDVLVNDIIIEITHAVLGNGLKNSFYSGNTALPGKG
ncbi:MAG: hypothetical protein EHM21_06420, partial [Chloroflexi bacterium]